MATIDKTQYEQLFRIGFNKGCSLINFIPVEVQKKTTEIFEQIASKNPNDIIAKGIVSGFKYEIEALRIKRMSQIKAIDQSRSESQEQER